MRTVRLVHRQEDSSTDPVVDVCLLRWLSHELAMALLISTKIAFLALTAAGGAQALWRQVIFFEG